MKIVHASTDKVEFTRQVKIQDFYEKNWNYILCPSKNRGEIVNYAKQIAEHEGIGYSQVYRHTTYYFLKEHKLNEITMHHKTYCDCSSFVELVLCNTGTIPIYQGLTTRDMIKKLCGFGVLSTKKYKKELLADGDIVLKEGSHCGIVFDTGKKIASNERQNELHEKEYCKVTANSLRVRETPNGVQIKSLFQGDVCEVLGFNGDWVNIKHKDIIGWVHIDYVVATKG